MILVRHRTIRGSRRPRRQPPSPQVAALEPVALCGGLVRVFEPTSPIKKPLGPSGSRDDPAFNPADPTAGRRGAQMMRRSRFTLSLCDAGDFLPRLPYQPERVVADSHQVATGGNHWFARYDRSRRRKPLTRVGVSATTMSPCFCRSLEHDESTSLQGDERCTYA